MGGRANGGRFGFLKFSEVLEALDRSGRLRGNKSSNFINVHQQCSGGFRALVSLKRRLKRLGVWRLASGGFTVGGFAFVLAFAAFALAFAF